MVNRGSFDKQRTRCLNKEQIVTRREEAHTGQELYKSKKCGKAFTERGSLTRHGRIHTNDEMVYEMNHI